MRTKSFWKFPAEGPNHHAWDPIVAMVRYSEKRYTADFHVENWFFAVPPKVAWRSGVEAAVFCWAKIEPLGQILNTFDIIYRCKIEQMMSKGRKHI